MPAFSIAQHIYPNALTLPENLFKLSAPTAAREAEFYLHLDATALTLRAWAQTGWHYFRLADGTVKLPPAETDVLACEAGDTYIAVSSGARHFTDSPTVARFIHLRDYFNADKLATALLQHIVAQATPAGVSCGVLVVEVR